MQMKLFPNLDPVKVVKPRQAPPNVSSAIIHWLADMRNFSRIILEKPLREYQLEPADAILKSVLGGAGEMFVVMMSRQAGKNELSAQLEAYLMNMYQRLGGQVVKASPTFKPQTINSILRLSDRLDNHWNRWQFHRREGYIVELNRARAFFFSAEPTANVVGATANILLEADEAQDIEQRKWDKDFTPMGASTNVTTVFYGTAWTQNTFLAKMASYLEQKQARDGVKRVFRFPCDVVAGEVPAYGDYVVRQVQRLGRNHPLIKTQYFLETIDSSGGLFSPARQRMMHGSHSRRISPQPGHRYAVLVDVGGEDENAGDMLDRMLLENPKRDATAVTVVDMVMDRSQQPAEMIYLVQDRQLTLGASFSAVRGQILRLVDFWHAQVVVVDATGIGAGLASFLAQPLGNRLIPVTFTPAIKSKMGWEFLGIVETGRYQDYAADLEPDTAQFWYEVQTCQYEIREGPQKQMRWGVWESPGYDGVVAHGHDDLLISAAMCTFLEHRLPSGDAVGTPVETGDVLESIDRAGWG
ncbi:MAG: hypothetical protein P1S60_08605 [Anaerolineae bacterium]|nr:hypothetical protein [Anaerolineae bacterium]